MSQYTCISNFGPNQSVNSNPLALCMTSQLDSGFNGTLGGANLSGPDNQLCQIFNAGYCAANWDNVCEYASKDASKNAPSVVLSSNAPQGNYLTALGSLLNKGQMLLRNTAAEKYLSEMSSNCVREFQPFDPTVPNSPLVSTWVNKTNTNCNNNLNNNMSDRCIPIYRVDPSKIDNDIVMNKILEQPWICTDILVNIYNNAVRTGEINKLKNTKLYVLFMSPNFQSIAKSGFYA